MEQFVNLAAVALASSCASGDATISVTNPTALPTSGTYSLVLETEILLATSRSGSVVNVLRGQEGTTAAAHASGVVVTPSLTARTLRQLVADAQAPAMAIVARPAVIGSWTVVGSMTLTQIGDQILLANTTATAPQCEVLTPIPGGVAAGGPWAVTLTAQAFAQQATTYPSFGLVVADGVTAGTSNALFLGWYQYGGLLAAGVWTEVLNNQIRPGVFYYTNASDFPVGDEVAFRLLCDGTNYFYQTSTNKGGTWRTVFSNTKAAVQSAGMGTLTHYGFVGGASNGSGNVTAFILGLEMVTLTLTQSAVSNVTLTNGALTVTTSTAHGLADGDTVSINNVVCASGYQVNGVTNSIVPTGTNTFVILQLLASSFTSYVSGGTVTKLN